MNIAVHKKRLEGFTIVELLIVVVVIAILAAITIVAFNGIQQRTRNTSRMNDAIQYHKLFLAYKASYDAYPVTAGTYCLGEGFPDVNSDSIGDCWDLHTGGTRHSVSSALNTELQKIATKLPSSTKTPVPGAGTTSRLGPVVDMANSRIIYWIEGTGDCPLGSPVWNDIASRSCGIRLPN